MIETDIQIGDKESIIEAYIVGYAPAEVLLGIPFLMANSKGFKMMDEEFLEDPSDERGEVCAVEERDDLEKILDEFPKLVLKEGEFPDPEKFYKGQIF